MHISCQICIYTASYDSSNLFLSPYIYLPSGIQNKVFVVIVNAPTKLSSTSVWILWRKLSISILKGCQCIQITRSGNQHVQIINKQMTTLGITKIRFSNSLLARSLIVWMRQTFTRFAWPFLVKWGFLKGGKTQGTVKITSYYKNPPVEDFLFGLIKV